MNYSAHWLGLKDYKIVLDLQMKAHQQVSDQKTGVVIGCEHPIVITGGRRSQNAVQHADIPVVQTDRGGLFTLHNPGQLVIYPICSLRELKTGVREWVDLLLETTSLSLKKCNIILISKNSGCFTKNGKIASVGITVSKGISRHGIAINVSNELQCFDLIDACGMRGQKMDRVRDYHANLTTEKLFAIWCDSFNSLTGSTIVTTNNVSNQSSLGAVGSAFP